MRLHFFVFTILLVLLFAAFYAKPTSTFLCFTLLLEELLGKAEAEAIEAVAGRDGVPKRNTAAPRIVEPTATTVHAVRATVRSCRIRLRATAIVAIPVRAPLPYVAAHIVDAEFIG